MILNFLDGPITDKSPTCINCKHCYIPMDTLLGVSTPELYCNQAKDKPLSGCVLTEPLDYYDIDVYDAQDLKWKKWAKDHKVEFNTYCSLFEGVKP